MTTMTTGTSASAQTVDVADIDVMLASPMSVVGRTHAAALHALTGRVGWVHDLKLDGIRALVSVTPERVEIRNRRGANITWRYPDVVATAAGYPTGIYDGEIVCVVDGRIDFPAIHKRDAQSSGTNAAIVARTLPAQFVAFDLLVDRNGHDRRVWDLARRRDILAATGVPVVPSSTDLTALWQVVVAGHLEGVVCKKLTSRYTGKRSRDWVKIKQQHTVTCAVIAIKPGEGSRADTLGALTVGLYRDGEFREIADVGSGFTDALLHEHWAPGQVIEVGYLDVSPGGYLRQPVFLRRRSDVGLDACTYDQIEADLTRQQVLR